LLVIISDIHLADGTCGRSVTPTAFHLFADRLKELARNASQRVGEKYQPVKNIDILLMGDILDPLHSTSWLDRDLGVPGFVRPWTDFRAPEFAAKLSEITHAILKNNLESITLLKSLTQATVTLPPATERGKMDKNACEIPINVRLHYMVGNHDWYYHLPGPSFNRIREEIVEAFGLSNTNQPFPHELRESARLSSLLNRYQVYAQHGDLHDAYNYSKEKGRNASSLGDAFSVEILNRFPLEVEKQLGSELPSGFVESLYELVSVRPALATPLWISSQLRQNNVSAANQKKVKEIWDEMCKKFLKLDYVKNYDIPFILDSVDGLEWAIRLTDRVSFQTIDNLVVWIRKKFTSGEVTFSQHALKEEAFLARKARFIVYGHTHHYEVVPLDSFPGTIQPTNQIYINSGTWHTYFDLAINKPEEQKFIPYEVLTYLCFYKDDERMGRRFETWSGSFSD
jgi:hypothetical protein